MSYDVIVIGAGHNGLSTAIELGRNGKKVVVLEKLRHAGGLAGAYEFHDGFVANGVLHDTSCFQNTLTRGFNLEQHGLRLSGNRPPVAILSKNGDSIVLQPDAKRTFEAIAKYSEKDAKAYLEYRDFIKKIRGFVTGLLYEKQPDLTKINFQTTLYALMKGLGLKRMGKETMLEFLKVAPMSVADFLNERFDTDFLKAGLAMPALLGSFTGPWSSYTTTNLLLWECASEENIIGGPGNLIESLEKAAEKYGVEIKTNSEVSEISLNESGNVEGVALTNGEQISATIVAASCSPRETFFRMIPSNEVGPSLEAEITNLRCRGTTAKINLALDRNIQWKFEIDENVNFFRTGNSIDEIERAFDFVKYGAYSEDPVLEIYIPSKENPSVAPDGHEVVSILAQYVPRELKGGWTDAEKEKLCDRIIHTLSKFTLGLEESIISKEILTPLDIEDRFNISGGNILHLEHAMDQIIGRPVPSCSQYKTPISGLFLCGSGSHPGGGITCAPGVLAARVILAKK